MRDVKRGAVPFLAVLAIVLVLSQAGFATPQSGQKVFWMVTTEVPLADLTAYHALSAEELFPLQTRHGYNWVANWQTIVGDRAVAQPIHRKRSHRGGVLRHRRDGRGL